MDMVKRKYHHWTPERDATLLALWPHKALCEIAAALDCSAPAVSLRARRLGLKAKRGKMAKGEVHTCAACDRPFVRYNKFTTRCNYCHDREVERWADYEVVEHHPRMKREV